MNDGRQGRRAARAAGLVALVVGATAGCANAGEELVLAVAGTSPLVGVAFLDADGDGATGGADFALPDVRVRVVVAGTRDTVASARTDVNGDFAFVLPVGSYQVIVPGEPWFADTIALTHIGGAGANVTLTPAGETAVTIAVSFPRVNVEDARALPIGRKVFVDGVALNNRAQFGDNILHLRDSTGAVRARVTSGQVLGAGDSVRVLGRVSALDGQSLLEQGQLTFLGIVAAPPPLTVETGIAATADGGPLDAALVRVTNVAVLDSATVSGDYTLTVDDGSGPLTVVFDQDASLTRTPYVPNVTIDVSGVLVPFEGGPWRLKPRLNSDLTLR
jgi:hypothetical protein